MDFVNFILDVAGLMLWLNWRSLGLDPLARATPGSLGGTLKRAGPPGPRRWQFLAVLAGLLILRAPLYWQIGAAVNWTPHLDLVATSVPFSSDSIGRMWLFSAASFGVTLALLYLWLLCLAVVNRSLGSDDPLQKLVRAQLGWPGRWPWWAQALLPFGVGALLWVGLHPLLVHWHLIPPAQTVARLGGQAILIGAGIYLGLKYLIVAVLLAHLLNTYLYLGAHPVWTYVSTTARHLLTPLRWIPLRVAKVDFAPVVGIALIFGLDELARRWLPRLYLF